MSRLTHAARSDAGSLPLTIIVVIAAAGLMAVLVNSVISAQRQVVFDRDFAHALPLADAGVALAQTRLTNDEPFTSESTGNPKPFREFSVGEQSVPETDTLDDQEFTWFVQRINQNQWEVTSSSEVNGTERVVVTTLEEDTDLFLAAFADEQITMRGANHADSYSSATGDWCTGMGVVGSNEEVDFKGGSTAKTTCDRPNGRTVDRVDLYDWSAFPDPDRCEPGHENCEEVTHNGEVFEAPRTIDEVLDLATDEGMAFITDALEACGEDAEREFEASKDLPEQGGVRVLTPAPNAQQAVATGDMGLAGGHYCYESMDFDEHTALHPSASSSNPVIIFVDKEVLIRGGGNNAVDVGCVDCEPGVDTPDAGALRIFVETGDVAVGNHAQFAGIMYAPRALCEGAGGNAQAHFYGSLICDEIDNQGGWGFHYDDALGNTGNGQFAVTGWREEVPTG